MMALNDPQSTFPVVISSFGTNSGFVLPTGGTHTNNATISNGSLVLTPNANSEAGIGVYGTPLPVDNGVQVTFSYTSSGGTGADGIAFFVLDPSQVTTPSTITPGGYGGGLGYADDNQAGITGGVLGIGFDTYGNFSGPDKGPQTGTGRAPNSVAIRGAGNASTTGYSLLDSTSFTPGIDGNRIAKVTLIPSGSNTIISVAISTDNGATFTTVINKLSVAQTLPSSVYYGFSASTGGSTDLHQINTMDVQLVVDPEVGPATVVDQTTSTTNPGTINPGDSVSYSYNVVNNGPNGSSQLTLTDNAPSNLINETYTIVDSLGTHTGTGAPDVSNLNLSNGATATVTVAGQIDPNATSGNISHVVTVVPSSAFVSSNPPSGTRAVSIGTGGSSLYLQNADGVSSVAGSSGAVPIVPAAVVNDEASTTNTLTATVVEANTGLGALSLTAGAPLAGTYSASTGTLTFSGTAAQIQAELRDVQFIPAARTASSSPTPETYRITVVDGTTGQQAVETRAVTNIDGPAASGPVGAGMLADTATDAVFSGVSITDSNNTSLSATVTVNAAHGDLTPGSAAGWTRSSSGTIVTYTRTYSASGTVAAAVQAGVRSLVFQPIAHSLAPGATEQDSFGLVVTDGAGISTPALSGTDTVTAAHDAPSVSGGAGGQSITDAQTTSPFSATTVADPDNTTLVETVTVNAAHGDLTAASSAGFARSASGTLVSYTETFASTGSGTAAAAAQAALRGLVFQPVAHAVALGSTETNTVAASITDAQGSTAASGTGTITVTPVHDAPALANPTAAQSITDAQTATPFSAATVADPDNTSITLTATLVGTSGDLTAASAAGWTRSSAAGTTAYIRSFAAGTGSAAAAQASLRSLMFQPTAHATAPGTSSITTFSAIATDSLGTSSPASASVTDTVTAVHDAPSVSGSAGGQSITDAQTATPFAATTVADPDNTTLVETVTVNAAHGDLTAASSAGFTRSVSGTLVNYTETLASTGSGTAAAAAQAALRGLVFQPTAHAIALGSTETDTVSATVTDAQGSTAASGTGTITVTPVHDAPSVSGGAGGQSITDAQTASPFAATTVADPDNTPLVETVTVKAAHGDLTAASSADFARSVSGTLVSYTETFASTGSGTAAAAAQAALRGLVFQPVAHAVALGSTETDTVSASITDAQGSTAASGTGTITVTPVHDAPSVSGGMANQAATAGSVILPFGDVAVADPDVVGLLAHVTVEGGASGAGTIVASSANGWVQTTQGNNTVLTRTFAYTSGVDMQLQDSLQMLAFTPGRAGLTGFDIQVTDEAASPLSSATDSDNSVLTASSGPSVTGGIAMQATSDVAALSPFAGDLVKDIGVADARAGVTVVGGVASGDDLTVASTQGWTRTVQGQDIVYTRGFAAGPGEAGDIQAAVRGLVLQPGAHVAAPGTVHTTPLQLSVSDAFGTALGDTTVTVTAATDQPVLGGDTPPLAIADIETASPYAALNVGEPDHVGATATVTISDGLDQGDFTPASTAGFTRTVSGRDIVYTLSLPSQADPGTLVQSAVRGLVFKPVMQPAGTTEQTAITLQTTFGGLASPPVRQVVITSGGALYPYPELYAQNPDPDAVVTVTANLPPGTAGYYATLGIGTVGPDPLTYTVTGTAAQVTAALHAVTFVLTSGTTLPGSYNARITGDGKQSQLLDLGAGNNQLSATNNNDTVLGGPGSDTIFGAATNAAVLIGGTGHNVFVAAAGATTAIGGTASSTFYGGSGDAVMIQGSGNDTFFGGTGNATVFGGSGSTLVYGSAGIFNLEGATGAATLVAGAGFNIAYGGAGSLIAYGSGSGLYEGGTSGGNVIISGAGSSTLVGGGNADQLVLVGGGTDLAVAGTGHETIAGVDATGTGLYFSGTNTTLIAVGSGQSTVVGGPGSDTIFAGKGSGALTFFGSRGNDLVVGNTGSDAFVVGSGNETLVGSGGRNTLVVQHGAAGGNVTVLDFNAATDQLDLFGYTASEVSGALAQETVSGGNLGLMLADGTRLTFVGVSDISHAVQHGNDRT